MTLPAAARRQRCLTAFFSSYSVATAHRFPGFKSSKGLPEQVANIVGSVTPGGRCGDMQELSWAAAFLCSPYANFVTGLNDTVDGDEYLRRSLSGTPFLPPRALAALAAEAS